ncbi:hypothetical protein D3C86_1328460 [compost metagenome]
MPAHIESNQPITLQLWAVDLLVPTQMAAKQTVDKDDGLPVRVAGLLHRDAHSIRRRHGVRFHGSLRQRGRRHQGQGGKALAPFAEEVERHHVEAPSNGKSPG